MTFCVLNYGTETLSVYTNTRFSIAAPNKNCFYLSWKEIAVALHLSYLFLKFLITLFMAWLLDVLKIHKSSWVQLKLLEYNWKISS